MRLFAALDPSAEVHDALVRLLDQLGPTARLRWTRPEGIHLTLKFIGEYPDERLTALEQTLAALPPPPPFEVRVSGLGFFPNPRNPRIFWAGIQAPDELVRLAAAIDQALEPLGIAPEHRAYSPHLTLARIEDRTPLDRLHPAIQTLPTLDFGAFTPDRFYLYRSQRTPSGSVYTRIREFPRTP